MWGPPGSGKTALLEYFCQKNPQWQLKWLEDANEVEKVLNNRCKPLGRQIMGYDCDQNHVPVALFKEKRRIFCPFIVLSNYRPPHNRIARMKVIHFPPKSPRQMFKQFLPFLPEPNDMRARNRLWLECKMSNGDFRYLNHLVTHWRAIQKVPNEVEDVKKITLPPQRKVPILIQNARKAWTAEKEWEMMVEDEHPEELRDRMHDFGGGKGRYSLEQLTNYYEALSMLDAKKMYHNDPKMNTYMHVSFPMMSLSSCDNNSGTFQ